MANLVRVQVLMPKPEAEQFATYYREKDYKKSSLITQFARDYLDKETLNPRLNLFNRDQRESEGL